MRYTQMCGAFPGSSQHFSFTVRFVRIHVGVFAMYSGCGQPIIPQVVHAIFLPGKECIVRPVISSDRFST